MSHSDQIREFQITDEGVKLKDAYVGPEGVLTGSARLAQEAREEAAKVKRQEDIERKQRIAGAQTAAGTGRPDRRVAHRVRGGGAGSSTH